MSFSDYAEAAVLDHVFGISAMTSPSNLYVALCTADPTDAGTGSTITEPSGNGYARVNFNTWTRSTSTVSNNGAITFPQASGSWGTLTHFAVLDAATNGNVLVHGSLTASKAVESGDTPSFPTGTLTATLD